MTLLLSRILFSGLALAEILAWTGTLPVPPPDFTWLGLIGTSIAVFAFVEFARLPGWLRILIWLQTAADALIDSLHIYSRWYPSDRIMHFMGGFVVALVVIYLSHRWLRRRNISLPREILILSLFGIFAAAFASILYEGWEFFIDLTYVKGSKALGDGRDTVDDELLALLGALIAASAHSAFEKFRRR